VPMVDVEFATKLTDLQRGGWIGSAAAAASAPLADYQQQIKCDATNIDHVTALVHAMEDRMAAGDLIGFEDRFNIINAHREKLMVAPADPGSKVQSAIHDTMSKLIELSLADRYRDRVARVRFLKQLKQMSSQDEFQAEYDKWINQANVLRAQGKVASTSLDNARAVDLEARRHGYALQLSNYDELNRGKKDARSAKRGK